MSQSPHRGRDILGISHVVIGVASVARAAETLQRLGFNCQHRRDDAPNPSQKAPFCIDDLAPRHDISIFQGAVPGPKIELVRPARADGAPLPSDAFSLYMGSPDSVDIDAIRSSSSWVTDDSLPGVYRRERLEPSSPQALAVHVRDIELAPRLWRDLGLSVEAADDRVLKIEVPGIVASGRLKVYVVANRPTAPRSHLDGCGVTCLAFLCSNGDRLRSRLKGAGYDISDDISYTPFGREFHIFFARNASGEIYEFLSVPRRMN